jgi:hypothetical protein
MHRSSMPVSASASASTNCAAADGEMGELAPLRALARQRSTTLATQRRADCTSACRAAA